MRRGKSGDCRLRHDFAAARNVRGWAGEFSEGEEQVTATVFSPVACVFSVTSLRAEWGISDTDP